MSMGGKGIGVGKGKGSELSGGGGTMGVGFNNGIIGDGIFGASREIGHGASMSTGNGHRGSMGVGWQDEGPSWGANKRPRF